jgi:hypothetical protein
LNCFSTPFRKSWEGEGRFLFFLGQNPLPHPIKAIPIIQGKCESLPCRSLQGHPIDS